ncbi:Uncharacterised protein [Vibrio cholerae]|nr:Uncharacterised protein [Vibrio cholerae]
MTSKKWLDNEKNPGSELVYNSANSGVVNHCKKAIAACGFLLAGFIPIPMSVWSVKKQPSPCFATGGRITPKSTLSVNGAISHEPAT